MQAQSLPWSPRGARGLVFRLVRGSHPCPRCFGFAKRLQRALSDVSLSGKNPTARDPARLGLFILGSRSAQRGPFTFISRRKIDTRPLRPVTSKKLRKSTRRRLRTASNWAAALGWRAAPARETLPRLRAMPDGRRGPLTGCMHTKTAGRSFGRTALRVGPLAELCSQLMLFATRDEMRDEIGRSQNSTTPTPHPAQVVEGWCADWRSSPSAPRRSSRPSRRARGGRR